MPTNRLAKNLKSCSPTHDCETSSHQVKSKLASQNYKLFIFNFKSQKCFFPQISIAVARWLFKLHFIDLGIWPWKKWEFSIDIGNSTIYVLLMENAAWFRQKSQFHENMTYVIMVKCTSKTKIHRQFSFKLAHYNRLAQPSIGQSEGSSRGFILVRTYPLKQSTRFSLDHPVLSNVHTVTKTSFNWVLNFPG